MFVVPSFPSHVISCFHGPQPDSSLHREARPRATRHVYGEACLFVCLHVENVKQYFSTASEHNNGPVWQAEFALNVQILLAAMHLYLPGALLLKLYIWDIFVSETMCHGH